MAEPGRIANNRLVR